MLSVFFLIFKLYIFLLKGSSVQFSCSFMSNSLDLFAKPWTAAHQAALSIANSRCLLKLMSIESVMPSNHLVLCRPLSSHLQSFPASGSFPVSWFFSSGGQSIRVSASASVLYDEYSRLISFRMNWLNLLTVQRTLKSLLQHPSSKASILWRSGLWSNSHIHTRLLVKPQL